jgi:hypothetical protein
MRPQIEQLQRILLQIKELPLLLKVRIARAGQVVSAVVPEYELVSFIPDPIMGLEVSMREKVCAEELGQM